MQRATEKGEQELRAKIERLSVQLEKLGRRIEEFPLCSDMSMMQQVQFHFAPADNHERTVPHFGKYTYLLSCLEFDEKTV